MSKKHQSPLVAAADTTATTAENKQQLRKERKSRKRARKEAQEDEEEAALTRLLFGGGNVVPNDEVVEEEKSNIYQPHQNEEEEEEFGFQIDRGGSGPKPEYDSDDDDDEEDASDNDDENSVEGDSPAWIDEDDDAEVKLVEGSSRLRKLRHSREETRALSAEELEQRLRKRYEESTQRTARTDWAKPARRKADDDDEEDEANRLFSTSGSLLASSRYRLPPSILKIVRCPDANQSDYSKAVVRSVHFHPGSDPDTPLMLTAGLDKSLRFFQVGAEKSEKIHGIHCKENANAHTHKVSSIFAFFFGSQNFLC